MHGEAHKDDNVVASVKIVDEALLREFRTAGLCELCKRYCKLREPHHIFARGMGGGGRLDVRYNLIALGSTAIFHPCHGDIHAGKVSRDAVIEIVAAREGVSVEAVMDEIWRLRRTIKP